MVRRSFMSFFGMLTYLKCVYLVHHRTVLSRRRVGVYHDWVQPTVPLMTSDITFVGTQTL